MNEILDLLKIEYGIISNNIIPTVGGFSAKAYRVKDMDGIDYFVKVYDKFLPTTRFYVDRIDNYMPVLDWLAKTPALHGRILTPISTKNGSYRAETDRNIVVLFLFVHGDLPKVQGMTLAQTVELAEILALLHNNGENIPFETHGLYEDTSLDFFERLAQFLDNLNAKNEVFYELINPHADILYSAIKHAQYLRDTIQLKHFNLVLCHGDAHGNNVIQSERLVLADWEDLRLAPAEADLFIHAWHKHGNILLEAYAAARHSYIINKELLYFYTLRRRIEDIWVDIQRLTEESPDKKEKAKLLDWIAEGIAKVKTTYYHADSVWH